MNDIRQDKTPIISARYLSIVTKNFFQRFSSFDIIDFPILKEVRIVRVAARAFLMYY